MTNTFAPPLPRKHGGLAVAALVCGIVGAFMGLIPLLALFAIVLGVLAIIFGGIGITPRGARRVMAGFGLALGILSLTLGIIGAVVVNDAVNDLDRDLKALTTETR